MADLGPVPGRRPRVSNRYPASKYVVLRRVTDNYEPRCTVYRASVEGA